MKAVILAGGRGSRMRELTLHRPKPMIPVRGKSLIEHKLDALPEYVTEVIIVTGYMGHVIRDYFGSSFGRFSIEYEEQKELNGTGGALWLCKERLAGEYFIVLMGDDIYDKRDIETLCMHEWAVLTKRASGVHSGGRIVLNGEGTVAEIHEGTHEGEGMLLNAAAYVMSSEIFDYDLVKLEGKEEYGLPQTIAVAAKDFPIKAVETSSWIQLSSPEDIASAEIGFSGMLGI